MQPCKVRCRTFARGDGRMRHSFLWCLDTMCPSNKSHVSNSLEGNPVLEPSLYNRKQRISTDGMSPGLYVVVNVDIKHILSFSRINLFENSKQALFVCKFPALFKPWRRVSLKRLVSNISPSCTLCRGMPLTALKRCHADWNMYCKGCLLGSTGGCVSS